MIVNEDGWLSIISKILIISLAIMIARKKYITVKEEK
jgi:CAAX amino protease